jgi:hypothetical protein
MRGLRALALRGQGPPPAPHNPAVGALPRTLNFASSQRIMFGPHASVVDEGKASNETRMGLLERAQTGTYSIGRYLRSA